MSGMNHSSLFSHLLLEEVIRSLAKERGMSESNSDLALGKSFVACCVKNKNKNECDSLFLS